MTHPRPALAGLALTLLLGACGAAGGGGGGTPGMWNGKATGAITLSMSGTAAFTNVSACPNAGGCLTIALFDNSGSRSSVTFVGLGTGEPKVGSYPLQVASQNGQWTGSWESGTNSSGSNQENVTSKSGTLKITTSTAASLAGTFDFTGDLQKQGNDTGNTAHLTGTFNAVAGQ